MTLQQILYFQRVARSGSFTKAARACFVSQTAISRQISALEEELHVTLLERDTAHVKLTLAGEYFFQQVNELTARLEEVVTRTQTIAQEQQTHLTLGIPTILEQHAISQLLRQYHSLHPEVQLSTVAGSRQQLVSQLVDRKIDLLVAMDFDLPSSVPGYLRPDLCSVPIDGPQWNFSFLLISRRERSRASVRAMFELAEHL